MGCGGVKCRSDCEVARSSGASVWDVVACREWVAGVEWGAGCVVRGGRVEDVGRRGLSVSDSSGISRESVSEVIIFEPF